MLCSSSETSATSSHMRTPTFVTTLSACERALLHHVSAVLHCKAPKIVDHVYCSCRCGGSFTYRNTTAFDQGALISMGKNASAN